MKTLLSFFVLFALCSAHGISGAQWVKMPCPFAPNTIIAHHGYIFAGAEAGVARSLDGISWDIEDNGLHGEIAPSPILSFCSSGNILIAGADFTEGIFTSPSDGNYWIRASDTLAPDGVVAFTVHDNFIIAASDNGTLTRSSDNGNSWITIDSGFTVKPDGFNGIALTSDYNNVYFGNNVGQIYRSSNDGDEWNLVYQDTSPSIFYSMATNGSVLFAQLQDSVLRSKDFGDTWDVSNTSFIGNKLFSFGNVIFDGGYYGVIYSPDNGDTWQTANDGLPDRAIIDGFAIYNGFIYVSAGSNSPDSSSGLWRRSVLDFPIDAVPTTKDENISVTLSPNPTEGIISIAHLPFNTQRISILNLLGETVTEVANPRTSNITIDLSKLPQGIYYARIKTPNAVIMKKFIRQ